MTDSLMLDEVNDEKLRDRLKYSVLYDYYGELLSDHNRDIFEGYVLEDMSLGELADSLEISRQGVRDSVNRSKKALEQYEDKLRLAEKHRQAEEIIESLKKQATEASYETDNKEIMKLVEELEQVIM